MKKNKLSFNKYVKKKGDKPNVSLGKFRINKLQNKFAIPVVILIAIILIAVSLFNASKERAFALESLKNRVITLNELSAIAVSDPMWNLNTDGVKAFGESLFQDIEVSTVKIFDAQGKEIYYSYMDGKHYQGKNLLYTDVPVMRGDTELGQVEIGMTSYFQLRRIREKLVSDLVVVLVTIVFLMIAITYISRRVTRPLNDLIVGTEKIASGDLSTQIPVTTNDEQLNSMI